MDRFVKLCAIALLAHTLPICAQSPAPQPTPTSLKWYTQIAKQRGLPNIELNYDPEGASLRPLKELVSNSLVVQGEVESSTVDASDGFQIFTWYRVKVIAKSPEPSWKGVIHSGGIPDTIPRAESGEILIRLDGGTTVVDGIPITVNAEPQLTVGKGYIFFLDPLDTTFKNKAFISTYQAQPLLLNGSGLIDHTSTRTFARRFDRFQSIEDVLGLAR